MRMSYDHIPFSSIHNFAMSNFSHLPHGGFMLVRNHVFWMLAAINKKNYNINNNDTNHENKNF